MVNFGFNNFKRGLMEGEFDLNATDDIRCILVESTSDLLAAGGEEYTTMNQGGTPAYYDGTNHDTTNGHALDSESVAIDTTNDQAEFDAADEVLSNLGAGTNDAAAVIIFKWVTNLASSIPLVALDTNGFPFNGNGGDVTLQWNAASGIFYI